VPLLSTSSFGAVGSTMLGTVRPAGGVNGTNAVPARLPNAT
jgi:hypothetical protein